MVGDRERKVKSKGGEVFNEDFGRGKRGSKELVERSSVGGKVENFAFSTGATTQRKGR